MLTEIEMDTKVCGKCGEVKTLDGFSKRRASKDGHQTKCKACVKKYRAANSEDIKEYNAEYCAANAEKIKDYKTEYHAANPEKRKENHAKWCAANPDYHAEYQKANPEKCRAWCSNRRAIKLKAIPSWLTEEDYQSMEAIYAEAKRLELETGTKMHVDHIHPLQGRYVCGLQCPSNLQILTAAQNCSKGNKFKPYVESEI